MVSWFLFCLWSFVQSGYAFVCRGPFGLWIYLGPGRNGSAGPPASIIPEEIDHRQLGPPE
jgi:hypothetical protein